MTLSRSCAAWQGMPGIGSFSYRRGSSGKAPITTLCRFINQFPPGDRGQHQQMGGVAQIGNNLNAEQRVPSGYAQASENAPSLSEHTKSSIQVDGAFQMLALPIFPGSRPPSIVGACELNFCVRDGNRWTLTAINTNSYG